MSSRRSRSGGMRMRMTFRRWNRSSRKRPSSTPLDEILVGGCDDPHIDDAHGHLAADPVELALGQHAQQSGLERRGHVADLVEEQGAAVGLLEAAGAARLGAGERALLVAKQLGLEQLSREWPPYSAQRRAARRAGCAGAARCATSSLPVPDSPVISTVMLEPDSRPMARNTSCMDAAWPIRLGRRGRSGSARTAPLSAPARRTSSTAWSMSKGLGRYSKAPPW
jgi:hypothetical protein